MPKIATFFLDGYISSCIRPVAILEVVCNNLRWKQVLLGRLLAIAESPRFRHVVSAIIYDPAFMLFAVTLQDIILSESPWCASPKYPNTRNMPGYFMSRLSRMTTLLMFTIRSPSSKRAFPKLMGLKRIVVGDPSGPWTSSEEFESFAQDNLEESYTDIIQSP